MEWVYSYNPSARTGPLLQRVFYIPLIKCCSVK